MTKLSAPNHLTRHNTYHSGHALASGGLTLVSRGNPCVKLIRALRHRKERERTGLAFAEGLRIVAESVRLSADLEALVVAPELLSSAFGRELVAAQQWRGLTCVELSAEAFASICTRERPEGIGALVRPRWVSLDDLAPLRGPGAIALHEVQYPGNLGTIVRTCDAVGGAGVILLGHAADPYDPTALRASMGAIFSVPLVRMTFRALVDWQRRHGYPLIGTSPFAAAAYRQVSYLLPAVLLMGSEARGLSVEQRAQCDFVVRNPMAGRSDSLNLAVAIGVVLYELVAQHCIRQHRDVARDATAATGPVG
ncbi:MAG: RNA methyltransferase [Chloroflexi bacterium]|nr:RNA methyltransferase [Chloroflexota bacterium]